MLSDCSIRLMKLLIQQEESTLSTLNTEITTMHDQLKEFENTSEYQTMYEKMLTNLKKLEDNVTSMKKAKFSRDVTDYHKNQVYNWKRTPARQFTPRPILKQDMFRSSHRTVSFSEANASTDISNMSGMENLADSSMEVLENEPISNPTGRYKQPHHGPWNAYVDYNHPPKNGGRGDRGGGGWGRGAPPHQPYNIKMRSK